MHGIHVYPESSKWQYPFPEILRNLHIRDQRLLVGNSLLLPVVAAWVFYTLSNLVCFDDPGDLPAEISEHQSDDEEDEEDEL